MELILETAVFCHKCRSIIKDNELADAECAYNCTTEPWENVEIVIRSKKDEQVKKALNNLERACQSICKVDAELEEY
jgi:RNA polymerase subunit RPABC4/transcription elongation factor Spt4